MAAVRFKRPQIYIIYFTLLQKPGLNFCVISSCLIYPVRSLQLHAVRGHTGFTLFRKSSQTGEGESKKSVFFLSLLYRKNFLFRPYASDGQVFPISRQGGLYLDDPFWSYFETSEPH